jgi:hypothetical protein
VPRGGKLRGSPRSSIRVEGGGSWRSVVFNISPFPRVSRGFHIWVYGHSIRSEHPKPELTFCFSPDQYCTSDGLCIQRSLLRPTRRSATPDSSDLLFEEVCLGSSAELGAQRSTLRFAPRETSTYLVIFTIKQTRSNPSADG